MIVTPFNSWITSPVSRPESTVAPNRESWSPCPWASSRHRPSARCGAVLAGAAGGETAGDWAAENGSGRQSNPSVRYGILGRGRVGRDQASFICRTARCRPGGRCCRSAAPSLPGGRAVRQQRRLGLSDLAILDQALAALSVALKVSRSELDWAGPGWHVYNWQADPFSRGAYSYVLTGGMGAAAELARPVERTLYFAGEATEGGFGGTVSTLASGYRAARELLDDLGGE